jgi:hypothetical protein
VNPNKTAKAVWQQKRQNWKLNKDLTGARNHEEGVEGGSICKGPKFLYSQMGINAQPPQLHFAQAQPMK